MVDGSGGWGEGVRARGGGRPSKAGRSARGESYLFSAVEDVHDLVLEQQPLVLVVVVVHEVLVILRVEVVDDAAVPLAIVRPVDAQPAADDGLLRGRMQLHVQQAPGLDGDQDRLAQRCGLTPPPHTRQDGVDRLVLEPPMTAQGKGAAMAIGAGLKVAKAARSVRGLRSRSANTTRQSAATPAARLPPAATEPGRSPPPRAR